MFTGVSLGQLVGGLGPFAVAALSWWWMNRMVLRGDLQSRKNYEQVLADRDYWRTAADGWQAMATKLGMSVEGLTSSVERLTASADASNHAMEEIQAALHREKP
ncbi:MAG: hypothetical protein ACXV3F_00375 [Frankiaceae bacterium]